MIHCKCAQLLLDIFPIWGSLPYTSFIKKLIVFLSISLVCTRRFLRNDQPSSSTCIPRPSSNLPTTHFPTPTLATIGSTMSQNTSSTVYHQPITFSTTSPAPSRPYLSTVSPNTTTHVTTMISINVPKANSRTTMDLRKKAFLFCLELIIIYHGS